MTGPTNRAAWLHQAGSPLQVDEAPLPTAGAGELIIKNAAVAINPLDSHMQGVGVFVQQWPAIFGCDVAGEVFAVGPGEERFRIGDRVIGVAVNLTSGRPQDGAFQLYSTIPAKKAAILPNEISFVDGVVVPFALEAAVCALSLQVPGVAMPGVSTPALGLPYPTLHAPAANDKVLVVYGGSSSVGSMVTQLATASGVEVISILGAHNLGLGRRCGASYTIDHKDPSLIEKVVDAVKASGKEFVGVFDAISVPDTYARNLAILARLGGGHLACVHPPPASGVPDNVQAGMIFAENDIVTPVWRDYVGPALKAGKLQCLPPPTIVGHGLEAINEALDKVKGGVSAAKLVVEL